MANLEETAVWTPGVYQLEVTDPVLGGPVQPAPATGGIANRAALALANRTAYLKDGLEQTNQTLESGLQDAATALAQTDADLQAQIELKANISSPALTGEPTAPTPAADDNSTRIATTAHVKAALAPKAPLASPALTGEPTSPTPDPDDESNRIATTAYVRSVIAETPDNLVTLDQYTSLRAENGWMRRPDGVIEQWGRFSEYSAHEGLKSVTFPIAFPNACINVIVIDMIPPPSINPSTLSWDTWTQVVDVLETKTGFSVNIQWPASGHRYWHGIYWRALGY